MSLKSSEKRVGFIPLYATVMYAQKDGVQTQETSKHLTTFCSTASQVVLLFIRKKNSCVRQTNSLIELVAAKNNELYWRLITFWDLYESK